MTIKVKGVEILLVHSPKEYHQNTPNSPYDAFTKNPDLVSFVIVSRERLRVKGMVMTL